MNVLRRIVMAIGGTVVIALVIGLAAPKTVHALVSTLVTVANTSANPVPTQSIDNPALHPFWAHAACTANYNDSACRAEQFLLVPAGMTAVVQYFSGYCGIGAIQIAPIDVGLTGINGDTTTGGNIEATIAGAPVFGDPTHYTFGGPTTLYATSTSGSQAYFNFSAALDGGGGCDMSISGYYVKNGL